MTASKLERGTPRNRSRVVVWCKVCGDVLDTDRMSPAAVCCCRNAGLLWPYAADPALVDIQTETR